LATVSCWLPVVNIRAAVVVEFEPVPACTCHCARTAVPGCTTLYHTRLYDAVALSRLDCFNTFVGKLVVAGWFNVNGWVYLYERETA
jgi:hypothetical protein